MGAVAGLVYSGNCSFKKSDSCNGKCRLIRRIAAAVAAEAIMCAGYFAFESILYGVPAAGLLLYSTAFRQLPELCLQRRSHTQSESSCNICLIIKPTAQIQIDFLIFISIILAIVTTCTSVRGFKMSFTIKFSRRDLLRIVPAFLLCAFGIVLSVLYGFMIQYSGMRVCLYCLLLRLPLSQTVPDIS